MRHFGAFIVAAATFSTSVLPLVAQTARQPQPAPAAQSQSVVGRSIVRSDAAGLSGTVTTPDGVPVDNVVVRARNLLTNEIDGSARTSDKGEYAILNVRPGNYVLEIVDDDGNILGTSAFVAATAGTIVSGLTITATTAVLSAAGTTTGLVSALGSTAARAVTAAAVAAGVAGVVVPPELPIASPSR
jgi:hypothetical protein